MSPGTNTRSSSPTGYVVLAFACIYLIWGSTYLAIRFAIDTIPPFLMVGIRYLLAGALLYGWVVWRGGARRPSAKEWRAAAFFGGCFFLFGNGGVSWAETRIASGAAALLVAMAPLWMTLMETYQRGWSRPTRLAVVGLVLGFAGVALLVRPGQSIADAPVDPLSALVMVVTTLGWAYGSVHAKDAPHPPSLLQTAAMQMLCGGLLALLFGTVLGEWRSFDPGGVTLRSAMAFLYLVVFGSIVAFSAYAYLLRVTRPTRVGTYAFVNPVVAVFLGWSLGGEAVTGRTLAAGAIVVLGVVLILRSRAQALGAVERGGGAATSR